MFRQFFKYCILIIAILAYSCQTFRQSDEDIIVASVGAKELTQTDLSELIPKDLNQSDSSVLAQEYINKWIKQELLVQKAEENLNVDQKDVSRELEEYRNSLIIYKYKNELLKQRMDTTVSENQVIEYYDTNQENFILSNNIVKAIFIKIPSEYANPEQLNNYCNDTSEEGLNELREYCIQYAKQFDIFIENWVDFGLVANNLPIQISNQKEWLSRNERTELNDSSYYYLVRIHNYKLKGDIAPVEYVTENIKNLILNKRKIAFLREIENNIYEEGVRKNKFKIIKQKTNE